MSIITLNQPYYYDNLVNDTAKLELLYYNQIKTYVIGTSYEGRDIIMLQVGTGDKKVLITGGVHGRETINPIVLMKMIETYCQENWNQLMDYTLYIIPLLNPDGYMIALRGFNIIKDESLRLAAKAKNIPYEEWKFNARGVDLNRNFPSVTWKQKFIGDVPASERETKALINIMDSIPTIAYLDYHSRGKEIYYYRSSMSKEYNQKQKEIALKMANSTGYTLVKPEGEINVNDSGGNTVHYYSETKKKPAFTIETVEEDATFPLKLEYQVETLHEILYTPFQVSYQ